MSEISIIEQYASEVLKNALEHLWEPHDMGNLIIILIGPMGLEGDALYNFLLKSKVVNPVVLSTLADKGIKFSFPELLSLLNSAGSESYIDFIIESIEEELIDLDNREMIRQVVNSIDGFSPQLIRRAAIGICELSKSKMKCGQILNVFCEKMNEKDVIKFVNDVISDAFFLDLRGDPGDFARAIPDVEDYILAHFQENNHLIEDSDEDEYGNLKGFIVKDKSDEKPRKLSRTK